jgi:hypothetical protein
VLDAVFAGDVGTGWAHCGLGKLLVRWDERSVTICSLVNFDHCLLHGGQEVDLGRRHREVYRPGMIIVVGRVVASMVEVRL